MNSNENKLIDLSPARPRGRLKIYLGFAPGVGKTYTMLREALYLKNQQYDVVIGWLDDQTRTGTLELAGQLEAVPPKQVEYRGSIFKEINVEEIVRRQPYLVLVDELAHTNVPNSLHDKRYQDIEYLRDRGINVMTTLNIQHVEGVKDAAARITGATVTETVPDWVLDKAEEVELIDVSPQVLQQRLKEGKIFPLEVVNRSTYGLFSSNKLLGLRELALIYVAEEVDERLEDYRKKLGLFNQINVHERVLVCVNSPFTTARLVALGTKMANRLMGELLVLYVETDPDLAEKEQDFEIVGEFDSADLNVAFEQIAKEINGRLVVAKVSSKSLIAYGITNVIKEKKITQVVIGESGIPRWKEILQGSIITKILAKIRNTDIFVAGNRDNLPEHYRSHKQISGAAKTALPQKTGKLKIYIGSSAGVGKTVAMLREAHELKNKGVNVVIGAIETHGRKETADYIADLDSVPLKTMTYRDVTMRELDVDGIVQYRPKVVLIDELAHTNVPGSNNEKRYQDVLDLMDQGIDVISAVNVQHIESLNDIVEEVTGVSVRETVPDVVIAKANELVMVDVTPENLRSRLRSGKIYAPEKIDQALNSFFRKENLQALRELALREIALDIEEGRELHQKLRNDFIETVLVCVQAKSNDDRLIRRGFKVAHRLKAELNVLHVMDGHIYSLAETQQLDLLKGLAERLGAVFNIERVQSKRQVMPAILQHMEQKKVTKLVLGQSARTRWEEVTQGSIINRLLRKARGIDILVIADN